MSDITDVAPFGPRSIPLKRVSLNITALRAVAVRRSFAFDELGVTTEFGI
jgi:hypothetical protein